MIYILGMSHIRALLESCSSEHWDVQGRKIAPGNAPAFVEWDVRPDVIDEQVRVASIYVSNIENHWGSIIAVEQKDGVMAAAPGFLELIESIEEFDATLFVCMHGEEHVQMSRGRSLEPYDFYLPSRPDLSLAPGRQVVPIDIVRQQVASLTMRALANFKVIRLLRPKLRVVNILCPPPVPASRFFPVGAASFRNAWSDDSFRLKNYLVYADTLAKKLAEYGVETLSPPAGTFGPDGFLLTEYVQDSVHANIQYGEQVWQQIKEVRAGRGA